MNIEERLHVTTLTTTRWRSLTRVHCCSASLCLSLEVLLFVVPCVQWEHLTEGPVSITLRRRTDCWASRPFTSANANLCGSDINLKVGLWRIDYFTGSFLSAQNVVVVQPTHIFTFSVEQNARTVNTAGQLPGLIALNSTISLGRPHFLGTVWLLTSTLQ